MAQKHDILIIKQKFSLLIWEQIVTKLAEDYGVGIQWFCPGNDYWAGVYRTLAGLMKNVQNYCDKGSRLCCSGCRMQTKWIAITRIK